MSTTVSTRTCENSSTPPLTPDRLLSAPLPVLLAAANADVITAVREYPNFDGTSILARSGRNLVVLPKGSSLRDREALVRELAFKLLGGAL